MALVLAAGAVFADEDGKTQKKEIGTLTFTCTVNSVWKPKYLFKIDYGQEQKDEFTKGIFPMGRTEGKINASPGNGYAFFLVDRTWCDEADGKTVKIRFDRSTLKGGWYWHCDKTDCYGPEIHFADDKQPIVPVDDGETDPRKKVTVKAVEGQPFTLEVTYPKAACGIGITDRRDNPKNIAWFGVHWGDKPVPAGYYTATMTVTFTVS